MTSDIIKRKEGQEVPQRVSHPKKGSGATTKRSPPAPPEPPTPMAPLHPAIYAAPPPPFAALPGAPFAAPPLPPPEVIFSRNYYCYPPHTCYCMFLLSLHPLLLHIATSILPILVTIPSFPSPFAPPHELSLSLFFTQPPVPEEVAPQAEVIPPHHILFAQNLPEDVTAEMLSTLFRQYAGFKETRLVAGKGVAFIEFETEGQAGTALEALKDFKLTPEVSLDLNYGRK